MTSFTRFLPEEGPVTEEERRRAQAAVYAAAGAYLAAGSVVCTTGVAPFLGGITRLNPR